MVFIYNPCDHFIGLMILYIINKTLNKLILIDYLIYLDNNKIYEPQMIAYRLEIEILYFLTLNTRLDGDGNLIVK